jgi:predicted lipoprotein with Yx(FWY)xxD motif
MSAVFGPSDGGNLTEEPAHEHWGRCSQRDRPTGYAICRVKQSHGEFRCPAATTPPLVRAYPRNPLTYDESNIRTDWSLMRHHHPAAIFSGALALTSFFAVGVGAAASAATVYGPTTRSSNTTSTIRVGQHPGTARTATVHTVTSDVHGKSESILVDAKGLPLYYHEGDTTKKSLVSRELGHLWPPLVSTNPTSITGTQGKLTGLKAGNGHQVTYNGRFLYTFIADIPRHVTGQGLSDFFVATPGLKPIGNSTPAATATPSGNGGYGS